MCGPKGVRACVRVKVSMYMPGANVGMHAGMHGAKVRACKMQTSAFYIYTHCSYLKLRSLYTYICNTREHKVHQCIML